MRSSRRRCCNAVGGRDDSAEAPAEPRLDGRGPLTARALLATLGSGGSGVPGDPAILGEERESAFPGRSARVTPTPNRPTAGAAGDEPLRRQPAARASSVSR